MKGVYYNENDQFAAQWLRNLIEAGHLPPGDVDQRSIQEVTPDDVQDYMHCHFFSGIGGWPLTLGYVGWPLDVPVWTGSCPCQPFSAAGKRGLESDPRHLWPVWEPLIAECRPATVFGEQVASKDGRNWFSGVRTDLEAMGYAVGAADLCSAGAGEKAQGRISYEDNSFEWREIVIGAPHIRQRLYWVADAAGSGLAQRAGQEVYSPSTEQRSERCGAARRMADATGARRTGTKDPGADSGDEGEGARGQQPERGSAARRVAQLQGEQPHRAGGTRRGHTREHARQRAAWSSSEVVHCTDGKARRFEPGSFPLSDEVSDRVGKIRGYGNAIDPEVAVDFVEAFMGIKKD